MHTEYTHDCFPLNSFESVQLVPILESMSMVQLKGEFWQPG